MYFTDHQVTCTKIFSLKTRMYLWNTQVLIQCRDRMNDTSLSVCVWCPIHLNIGCIHCYNRIHGWFADFLYDSLFRNKGTIRWFLSSFTRALYISLKYYWVSGNSWQNSILKRIVIKQNNWYWNLPFIKLIPSKLNAKYH